MFLLILLLVCLLCLFSYTKSDIAEWYGVSRPTLRKWIRHLDVTPDYASWKSRRKFPGFEVLVLVLNLGDPEDGTCMTKGQIKNWCETEYQTITDMVALNASELGIDINTYRCMDVFPPLLSKHLVSMMG